MIVVPAFLVSFVAIARQPPNQLVLSFAMAKSWTKRVFEQLNFPPGFDDADQPAPPAVLIAAKRWPAPNEADEAVIAESAIRVLEQLLGYRAWIVWTPNLARSLRRLRDAIDLLMIEMEPRR